MPLSCRKAAAGWVIVARHIVGAVAVRRIVGAAAVQHIVGAAHARTAGPERNALAPYTVSEPRVESSSWLARQNARGASDVVFGKDEV